MLQDKSVDLNFLRKKRIKSTLETTPTTQSSIRRIEPTTSMGNANSDSEPQEGNLQPGGPSSSTVAGRTEVVPPESALAKHASGESVIL